MVRSLPQTESAVSVEKHVLRKGHAWHPSLYQCKLWCQKYNRNKMFAPRSKPRMMGWKEDSMDCVEIGDDNSTVVKDIVHCMTVIQSSQLYNKKNCTVNNLVSMLNVKCKSFFKCKKTH